MQGNSCNKREYERAALVIVVKGTLLTPTQRLRASSEPPPRALLQHLGAEGLSRLQNALPLAPAARDIIRPCGSSARRCVRTRCDLLLVPCVVFRPRRRPRLSMPQASGAVGAGLRVPDKPGGKREIRDGAVCARGNV